MSNQNFGIFTDDVELHYGIEGAQGAAPSEFERIGVRDISNLSATIGTSDTDDIGDGRSRDKGHVTSLSSGAGFSGDQYLSVIRNFIPAFLTGIPFRRDIQLMRGTGTTATSKRYGLATNLVAGNAAKLVDNALVNVIGCENEANNGIKSIDGSTAAAANDSYITVNETVVTESNNDIRISGIGYRVDSGTSGVTFRYDSTTSKGTLTITGHNLVAQGLQVGQPLRIGQNTDGTPTNALDHASGTDNIYGKCIVEAITTNTVVVRACGEFLRQATGTDATPGGDLDLLFGEVCFDTARSDSNYELQCFQYEGRFPGLAAGGADLYRYSLGNVPNTMTLAYEPDSLASFTMDMMGRDTETAAAGDARASLPHQPIQLPDRFNTTSSFGRISVTGIDEVAVGTGFDSLNITINNNANAKRQLASLATRRINLGQFVADAAAVMTFESPEILDIVRNHTDITMFLSLDNDDGCFDMDFSSMTASGGDLTFPRNDLVGINLTNMAHKGGPENKTITYHTLLVRDVTRD